jgi:ABC-2 type transport system ATP-binding protein
MTTQSPLVATSPAAPAIVVESLGKVFRPPASLRQMLRGRLFGRPIEALSDVSFTAAQGEILCMMGPNGAGKSTLTRILGGLLMPTRGRAQVAGMDVASGTAAFRRRVTFAVGDERSFHFGVSGRINLHYFAALHGLTGAEGRRRTAELLERVGLGEAADRLYREYSRGMRQRLAVARGLLGDPAVLLLDEPTLGLDPKGARDMRLFLREEVIRKVGRTAIVCSNDPTEARAMADRVLFLERGRLRAEAPPSMIEAELGL